MTALKLKRTEPGRYYGRGASHAYLIVREAGGWEVTIWPTIVVAGVQVAADKTPQRHWTGWLAVAKAICSGHEQLGDNYKPHEHGHVERFTYAIQLAYEADKKAGS